jgi:pimeloyl-ACP methyl ester carboxylesterase
MDRSTSFTPVVQALAGLAVLTYDRRGYARSADAQPPATTVADHVADLTALLDGRTAVVVGHSYGADVALAAALAGDADIAAVGAFEPPTPWLPGWATPGAESLISGEPAATAERFFRHLVGDEAWDRLPERTRQARRAEGRALLSDVESITRPPGPWQPDDLRRLAERIPVLLGCGRQSWRHQRESAEGLSTATGIPTTWIDGAGHGAHISHPAEFAAWVRSVVERSGLASATP